MKLNFKEWSIHKKLVVAWGVATAITAIGIILKIVALILDVQFNDWLRDQIDHYNSTDQDILHGTKGKIIQNNSYPLASIIGIVVSPIVVMTGWRVIIRAKKYQTPIRPKFFLTMGVLGTILLALIIVLVSLSKNKGVSGLDDSYKDFKDLVNAKIDSYHAQAFTWSGIALSAIGTASYWFAYKLARDIRSDQQDAMSII